MDKIYEELLVHLEKENKEKAVEFVLSEMKKNQINIIALYTEVLAPALNNMECKLEDKSICIWREHVRSSIIRTIIECCYPYVIEERNKRAALRKQEKVVIVCPTEEYHEIGARMAADFFTICGYDTTFVGSNTPKEDFLAAIKIVKPKFIVISVSNYYNLVTAKKAIDKIKEEKSFQGIILVGGHAFKSHPEAYKQVGAHKFIDSFEDIIALEGGQK